MTLGKIAQQAVTVGECELTEFAFSCMHFMVHPSALQPYEELLGCEELLTPKRSWC